MINLLNPTPLGQLTPEPLVPPAWRVKSIAGSIADTAITGQRDISLSVHPAIAGIRVMSMLRHPAIAGQRLQRVNSICWTCIDITRRNEHSKECRNPHQHCIYAFDLPRDLDLHVFHDSWWNISGDLNGIGFSRYRVEKQTIAGRIPTLQLLLAWVARCRLFYSYRVQDIWPVDIFRSARTEST